MNSQHTDSNRIGALFLWVTVTAIGWAFGFLNLVNAHAQTYLEVVGLIPVYAAQGLLIGLVTGIGQSLVLRPRASRPAQWFWPTLLGYGLAFPVGLGISTLIPSIAFPLRGLGFLPLVEPSTLSFSPYPTSLITSGFVVGIAQWRPLRHILPKLNSIMAAFWILSVWLGIGLGVFMDAWAYTFVDNASTANLVQLVLQRMAIGAVVGIITGMVLLTLLSQADSQNRRIVGKV